MRPKVGHAVLTSKRYNSLPVLNANIAHDLLADAKVGSVPVEKKYTFKPAETQLVPVGPKTGMSRVYH